MAWRGSLSRSLLSSPRQGLPPSALRRHSQLQPASFLPRSSPLASGPVASPSPTPGVPHFALCLILLS
ncbi:hypothetical protein SASPL_101166 [Salvia splendens]|uniref:Uncharacterized protein n=1 Tax=Salvia splendens TaxID=180675 RepID=A0A8X8YUB8_SALSN|nr:hypothetical protein SASPL_101166 [Salvia splendens]